MTLAIKDSQPKPNILPAKMNMRNELFDMAVQNGSIVASNHWSPYSF